jgi:hypothetical protein
VAFVPPANFPFIAPETSLTVAVPSNPPWKECTIAATLKDKSDNPLQNFDIDFLWTHILDDGTDCGPHLLGSAKTDSKGVASLTYSFWSEGTYNVTAMFSGTTNYAQSSSEYVDIMIIDYTPFLGGGGIIAVASIVGYIVFRRRKKIRIEILKMLSHRSGSVKEVLSELNNRGFTIRYRDSVYRALEKLTVAGFLEKYYGKEGGGIRYRLLGTKLEADLRSGN